MRPLVALLLATILSAGAAATASAHPLSSSALPLDVRPERVGGELQLPLDRLRVARGRGPAPAGHRAFATIREDGVVRPLGIFDGSSRSLAVDGGAERGSFVRDVGSSARLGVEHVAEGADHMLFLLMLLIAARSVLRVVHVVTAFALGHSITLALAALGLIDVPTRLVESVIALSVLVSAVHAVRPLVPGGEAWIAVGFGLVHGLAFAALVGDSGSAAARSCPRCWASTSASRSPSCSWSPW